MSEPLYYIMNATGACGNSALWWRVDGHGYTSNLREAWLVTAEKALSICRDRPKQDIPYEAGAINAVAELHFDVQRLAQYGGKIRPLACVNGMPVIVDTTVPPGEIQVRNPDGTIVGKITGLEAKP